MTAENVASIREFSATVANELDLKLVDRSGDYPSQNIAPSESLALEIRGKDGRLMILSSGLLTPTFCYYGSSQSRTTQSLIERFIEHLRRQELQMKMRNDNKLDALPDETEDFIRSHPQPQ